MLEVTGYPIGAVSPFGTVRPRRLLVDPGVFTEEEVSIGSGRRGTTIIMASKELQRALGDMEVINLLQESA